MVTLHVSLSTEHAATDQLLTPSQDFTTSPQSCVMYLYQCVGPEESVSLRNGGGGGRGEEGGGRDSSECRFFYPQIGIS